MNRILRWMLRKGKLWAACDDLLSACYMLVRYVMTNTEDVPSEVVFGLAAIEKAEEVLGEG